MNFSSAVVGDVTTMQLVFAAAVAADGDQLVCVDADGAVRMKQHVSAAAAELGKTTQSVLAAAVVEEAVEMLHLVSAAAAVLKDVAAC